LRSVTYAKTPVAAVPVAVGVAVAVDVAVGPVFVGDAVAVGVTHAQHPETPGWQARTSPSSQMSGFCRHNPHACA
jgi:hypothetical protein